MNVLHDVRDHPPIYDKINSLILWIIFSPGFRLKHVWFFGSPNWNQPTHVCCCEQISHPGLGPHVTVANESVSRLGLHLNMFQGILVMTRRASILGSKVVANGFFSKQDLSDIVTSDVDLLGKTLASLCPWSKVFVVKLRLATNFRDRCWKITTGVIKCYPFWEGSKLIQRYDDFEGFSLQ